jgi:hypothetical protein
MPVGDQHFAWPAAAFGAGVPAEPALGAQFVLAPEPPLDASLALPLPPTLPEDAPEAVVLDPEPVPEPPPEPLVLPVVPAPEPVPAPEVPPPLVCAIADVASPSLLITLRLPNRRGDGKFLHGPIRGQWINRRFKSE